MAKRADIPCAGGCGRMLWRGPGSLPPGEATCRDCRRVAKDAPEASAGLPAVPPEWIPPEHGLADRGRRLYREFTADGPLTGGERVLLEEACRLTDRLDQLDDFLRGHEGAWMRFHARNEDGSIVEVVVDKALAEARQQASTLKALIVELRASRAGKKEEPKPEATRRDELAKRREERRRAAGL
jgi:hypothetical protein